MPYLGPSKVTAQADEECFFVIEFKDISSLPLATNSKARHWNASLREMRSVRTELITSRNNSSFSFKNTPHATYPTCFSAYLHKIFEKQQLRI